MVMDRDFPMERWQKLALAVGLAAMFGAGVLLFGGFLPGLHPSFASSGILTLSGHQYYDLASPLHLPLGTNSTLPWNVTFHNVTYQLWLSGWYGVTGGLIHGTGTELNGSSYSFVLGDALSNGTSRSLYLSPDFAFGAWWFGGPVGGFFVHLLVEV